MNKQELREYKKITIGFSNSQKEIFFLKDFNQDELREILAQLKNGNALIIRNFYANPKNVNYIIIDDFEECEESKYE